MAVRYRKNYQPSVKQELANMILVAAEEGDVLLAPIFDSKTFAIDNGRSTSHNPYKACGTHYKIE